MGGQDGRPGAERRAIEAALVTLAAKYGYTDLRLEELLQRAGVAREEFEREFASLDECFSLTWRRIDEERRQLTSAALDGERDWRSGIRAALAAALGFLAEDPDRARFYVIESVSAPESHAGPREEAVRRIRAAIAAGDPNHERPELMTRALADAIAGGIWMRLSTVIGEGRAAELPGELSQLMYFVVLPYFGRRAADEELSRT
jgi:AcrR family transcriptional regulator